MPAAPFDTDVVAEASRVFATHHARGAAPSVAWGIFNQDGLQHFSSAGSLPSGALPHRDTAYRVASCTKSFTAAAVLSLRDAGRLSLDDPVTRFVPAFEAVQLPATDAALPTIRMLLTMSGGFPTDDPWADRQESISAAQFTELVQSGLSFEYLPGAGYAYSNLGYALLGRVVEQAAGLSYREVIRDLFLEPLGLTCTGFDSSVADGAELALGHRWIDGSWHPLPLSAPGAFSPIGGLFSTVTDLSRWAGWLGEAFLPGETTGTFAQTATPEPLSRSSRREMQQLHRFVQGSAHLLGYGFGLFVEPRREGESVVSHSGGYPGYSAHMRWSATGGYGVIAFENATHSRVSVPATEAFELLLTSQPTPPAPIWAAARDAQSKITELIVTAAEVEELAAGPFADNVPLDEAWERRRASIARASAEIGGLLPTTSERLPELFGGARAADEESTGAAHLVWYLAGVAGRMRVEIRLTPQFPPLVQSLKVSADRV
jgi:CubicO group peptidase (beta-lactamase class C family)